MGKRRIEPGPFVVPMPVVLVGANVNGSPNFMTAAFVGIVNYRPPIVACGLNPDHHTSAGIAENGTFSLNLPSKELVAATDYCGLHSGKKENKSTLFKTFTGPLGTAPMIDECRLTVECRVVRTIDFEVDRVYFGEVVHVHADEDMFEGGELSWQKINPLIFTFPDKKYWDLGACVARAWSVGKDFKP